MMRKLVYICIIVFLTGESFFCQGRSAMDIETDIKSINTLELLLSKSKDTRFSISEYRELLETIKSKRARFSDDQQYLQHIYKYVHRKNLKQYKTYVTIEETLSKSGYYDCLTGTLLYGLILEELGFDVTIREFNYHVLLIVNLGQKRILIESTDPLNGFVVGDDAINERINTYKQEDRRKKRHSVYGFIQVIDNKISINQLVGLHFYNQAINSLNHLNLEAAKLEINKAYKLYPSERVKEISKLIKGSEIQSLIASIK